MIIPLRTFASIFLLLSFGWGIASAVFIFSPNFFSLPQDRPGCDSPIPYRVEFIDSRFPLGNKDFFHAVLEAELVWEHGIGRDLFIFDPNATFPIQTTFDDRQKMTDESEILEKNIESSNEKIENLQENYQKLVSEYESSSKKLEDDAKKANKKVARYNEDVEKWNSLGGAPEEEYEDLIDQLSSIEKEQKRLEKESSRLANLADKINSLSGDIHKNASSIQEKIQSFTKRYGEPKPFIQGLYEGPLQSITIYQFKEKDDLRLVLAHEFGHALGIEGHAEDDPEALMYFMMGAQNLEDPELREADKIMFEKACPERILSKKDTIMQYLLLTPRESLKFSDFFRIVFK